MISSTVRYPGGGRLIGVMARSATDWTQALNDRTGSQEMYESLPWPKGRPAPVRG